MVGGEIKICNYVVCLIDILGQQHRLSNWPNIPEKVETTGDFIQAVKKNAGTISALKKNFVLCFQDFQQLGREPYAPQDMIDAYPEFVEEYHQIRKKEYAHKVEVQQFSDTLIFYSPIIFDSAPTKITLQPLLSIVSACAYMMLDALQAGVFFRGGDCYLIVVCIIEIAVFMDRPLWRRIILNHKKRIIPE